jgi:hypothetical protein
LTDNLGISVDHQVLVSRLVTTVVGVSTTSNYNRNAVFNIKTISPFSLSVVFLCVFLLVKKKRRKFGVSFYLPLTVERKTEEALTAENIFKKVCECGVKRRRKKKKESIIFFNQGEINFFFSGVKRSVTQLTTARENSGLTHFGFPSFLIFNWASRKRSCVFLFKNSTSY